MASLAQEIPNQPRPVTWFWEFLKHELAPYPGRTATVARMVLAATLVMVICNTFRIPYAFVGGIFALLISRESPRATLNSAGTVLLLAAAAVAYILVSVQLVISVPSLHFLWVIVSLFVAFYSLRAVANYGAFVAFSMVMCIAVTIWDRHVSSETNVEATLDLSLVALIAVVVTSGIELAFLRLKPGDDIVGPLADRLDAIHNVLRSYSEGSALNQAKEEKIIRLGMLGTSTLRRALSRSDYSPLYRTQMSGAVELVGRLVDITTALTQLSFEPSSIDQEHLRNLAWAVAGIRSDVLHRRIPGPTPVSAEHEHHRMPLLRDLENTVALIPQAFAGSRSIDEYQTSPEKTPGSKLFVADAFVNPAHLKYALKGCFAASACYVIYNSIDWLGMGVPVMLTCFYTAVSTIGTSRQRQILRFAGFVVGGLVIGMTAQVFLLPYLDSITAFTVFFMLVTGLGAWFMTSSPRLSFFGLQLTAMFYVINMQKFARETSLAVARDRAAGVFLGLLMMWLIFDQIWGDSASVAMRRVFISTLRLLAQLMREPVSSERTAALRDALNTKFDSVRSLADGVLLEFGSSRRRDLEMRDRIRRWQPQLRALFIMRVAMLDVELPEAVIAFVRAHDECSARKLDNIADRMEGKTLSAGLPAPLEPTLSEQAAGLVPLLREIDRLTTRLTNQIAIEMA